MSARESVDAVARSLVGHHFVEHEPRVGEHVDISSEAAEHLALEAVAAATPFILAAEREHIAQAVEAEASRSSYRDADDVTEAYLNAARIARTPPT